MSDLKGGIATIRHHLGRMRQLLCCYLEKWSKMKAVYLIMTPEHGNLGDHAITYAETKMLDQLQIPYICVSTDRLKEWEDKNLLHVMNGRTILINGGGNLGTIWFSLERVIRGVIQANPDSAILILPNTMYYHDDEIGRKELKASIEVYNRHPGLTVYAREKYTYEAAEKIYRDVKLVPDMALLLNFSEPHFEREGCVICLRSDKEKTRTDAEDAEILRQMNNMFGEKILFQDMNVKHPVSAQNRDTELLKQLDCFKRAQLVITDRLHGMVFCAISGTPCVVINSQSPKVKGCFEWIRNLDYIRFCDDVSQLSYVVQSLPQGPNNYDNSSLLPFFSMLEKDIQLAAQNKIK